MDKTKAWLIFPKDLDFVGRMSQHIWWNIEHPQAALAREKLMGDLQHYQAEIVILEPSIVLTA